MVKVNIHTNKYCCDSSQDVCMENNIKYESPMGIIPRRKYGCLLPNLCLVLSEITPISGSVNASTIKAIKIAKLAKPGLSPITLE
jgi:hypothetical protein